MIEEDTVVNTDMNESDVGVMLDNLEEEVATDLARQAKEEEEQGLPWNPMEETETSN